MAHRQNETKIHTVTLLFKMYELALSDESRSVKTPSRLSNQSTSLVSVCFSRSLVVKSEWSEDRPCSRKSQ